MPIYVPGKMCLHQPQYPTSPAPVNGDVWVDPVTGTSWTYQSSTSTWILT